VGAFYRYGDGPWVLLHDGKVGPADTAHSKWVPRGASPYCAKLIAASPDGSRILARRVGPGEGAHLLHLSDRDEGEWKLVTMTHGLSVVRDVQAPPSNFSPRNRFSALLIGEDGLPALRAPGCVWQIEPPGVRVVQRPTEQWPGHDSRVLFRPFAQRIAHRAGFTLRAARWADGSRAILDSRGLLHLISSDTRLPQITLTLSTGPTAVWTSDGRSCGWSYFLRDKATMSESLALKFLTDFTSRLR
jgi:hypothetical protein